MNMAADTQTPGGPAPVRVVLVDDEPLVLMGLRALLSTQDDMVVVGEAGDGVEALELCRRDPPDVLVLDVRMPRMDGLGLLRALRADPRTDGVRVIILTTFDGDETIVQALRDGASGFLVKDGEPESLLNAIRSVRDGHAHLAPSVTHTVIDRMLRSTPTVVDVPGMADLTDREREVVSLAAQGMSNLEISRELCISVGTVRTHVARAMFKLDVHDRAHLVALAHQTGLAHYR